MSATVAAMDPPKATDLPRDQPVDAMEGMDADPPPDSPKPAGPPSDMVSVPAACFQRGSPDGDPDEVPVAEVCLPAFQLDRTEVTVAAFKKCVATGKCTIQDRFSQDEEDGKPTWKRFCNYGRDDRDDHPVNCVRWAEAKAYCEWAGKRLPTEAEWELAARGTDGRRFPWGAAAPSCDRAIMDDAGGEGCGQDRTWPVGSKPQGAGPYGAVDLSGNVWEWVEDCWELKFYQQCGEKCQSPVNRCTKANPQRVMRGGSYVNKKPGGLRGAVRGNYAQRSTAQTIGFRCAKDGAGGAEAEQLLKITAVTASSSLPRYKEHTFPPSNLIDGQVTTSWQPRNSKVDSVGEWFQLDLGAEVTLTRLEIANGYQRTDGDGDQFFRNSRLKDLRLTFSDGSSGTASLPADAKGFVSIKLPPRKTRWVKVEIVSIHKGANYNDVAVSEVRVYGR